MLEKLKYREANIRVMFSRKIQLPEPMNTNELRNYVMKLVDELREDAPEEWLLTTVDYTKYARTKQ
jgi:hypothetical protein